MKLESACFLITCVVVAGSVLAFDLGHPQGVAGGVPYVLLVLLGLAAKRYSVVIALTVAATVLTVLGFGWSSPEAPLAVVMLNRGLALFAIWAVALAMMLVILQRKRLQILIDRDALTGTYNRKYLMNILQREIELWRRDPRPLSLIMLDIDHFKIVNDRFGHQAGDRVLRQVAQICAATVRSTDWVCRFGGEEFAIVLPNADRLSATDVAERIRQSVHNAHFDGAREPVRITVSLGLSVMSSEYADEDALLAAADKALYRSKDLGRNQVNVYPGDGAQAQAGVKPWNQSLQMS